MQALIKRFTFGLKSSVHINKGIDTILKVLAEFNRCSLMNPSKATDFCYGL